MTSHRALAGSGACWGAVVLLLAVGTGSVAVAGAAAAAGVALVAGAALGLPVAVLVGAAALMGAALLAAGTGAPTGVLVAVAPLLWAAVEAAWRSLDLRGPARRAGRGGEDPSGRGAGVEVEPAAGRAWLATAGAVVLGTGAAGLAVVPLAERAPSGGLTFLVLGVGVVVLAAVALVLADLRPGRWVDPGGPARGSGSPGPRPRTGRRLPG